MHLPLLDPLINLEAHACWQVLWQAVASGCGRWRIGWPFLRHWWPAVASVAHGCWRLPARIMVILSCFLLLGVVFFIYKFFFIFFCWAWRFSFIYFIFFVGRGVLIVIWR